MTLNPLDIVLFGVVLLLIVGFYGLLITRNLIKIVLVLQILVKAVVIALVLAGKSSGNLGTRRQQQRRACRPRRRVVCDCGAQCLYTASRFVQGKFGIGRLAPRTLVSVCRGK